MAFWLIVNFICQNTFVIICQLVCFTPVLGTQGLNNFEAISQWNLQPMMEGRDGLNSGESNFTMCSIILPQST